ncbi:MAG: hypothetical protein WD625_02735 [Balneolales bacterium]
MADRCYVRASALNERTTPGTGKGSHSGTRSKQPSDGPRLLVTTGCVGRPGSRVQIRQAWTLGGARGTLGRAERR